MTDLSQMPFVPIRVATALGTLVLHPRRFDDLGALADAGPDDAPADRLRRLFARVTTREGESREATVEAASPLADDDLESVAAAYLAIPDVRLLAEGSAGRPPLPRDDGESATVYLDRLLRADHERQLADLGGTFEALHARPGDALAAALADLDRQAAALRQAVARLNDADSTSGAGLAGDAAASEDATTADAGAYAERIGATELTRGLARVTAQSALLLAGVGESSTAFQRRYALEGDKLARTAWRWTLGLAALAAVLAAAAAVIAAIGLVEERDNVRQVQRWQESLAQARKDDAAAQASAEQAVDARLREISERQAASAAAIRSALASPAPAASEPAATVGARHEPAKAATTTRNTKRKANR